MMMMMMKGTYGIIDEDHWCNKLKKRDNQKLVISYLVMLTLHFASTLLTSHQLCNCHAIVLHESLTVMIESIKAYLILSRQGLTAFLILYQTCNKITIWYVSIHHCYASYYLVWVGIYLQSKSYPTYIYPCRITAF